MAVHYLEISLDLPDAAEHVNDPYRTVSDTNPDGTPDIHVGAFRGIAFALIFETVLVLLGALSWQIFRTLH